MKNKRQRTIYAEIYNAEPAAIRIVKIENKKYFNHNMIHAIVTTTRHSLYKKGTEIRVMPDKIVYKTRSGRFIPVSLAEVQERLAET